MFHGLAYVLQVLFSNKIFPALWLHSLHSPLNYLIIGFDLLCVQQMA